ncbi:TraV family lipoprotein [Pseudoalteromonas luteoviolacea]|jgi:hypothetical protein|uniref:TraV family lipoprotein n=1 Tax=Pseudoalteromonas luteoviolacea TaxID=43657 RepID=UPI001B35BD14|nr:TraV family lipoprotein [Pseudoalteromonas luteoviolacea]MBQ4840001.1 TraV family lipoprotein [Pseudoalteromonas luteoviolacea]
MKKLLFLAFTFSLMSGCATNYSCGQFPESGCQPVSTVYDRTNDGYHDYRRTLYDEEKSEGSRGESDAHVHVGQAHRTLNYNTPGDPILTKPVVLRILFNSWEDKEKDLNAGGFVYVRLRDSEWVIN